jgi:hypothetical protein
MFVYESEIKPMMMHDNDDDEDDAWQPSLVQNKPNSTDKRKNLGRNQNVAMKQEGMPI